MKRSESEQLTRVTIALGEPERRELLAKAAARTVSEGRPVSLSEVARGAVRAGLEAQSASAA